MEIAAKTINEFQKLLRQSGTARTCFSVVAEALSGIAEKLSGDNLNKTALREDIDNIRQLFLKDDSGSVQTSINTYAQFNESAGYQKVADFVKQHPLRVDENLSVYLTKHRLDFMGARVINFFNRIKGLEDLTITELASKLTIKVEDNNAWAYVDEKFCEVKGFGKQTAFCLKALVENALDAEGQPAALTLKFT